MLKSQKCKAGTATKPGRKCVHQSGTDMLLAMSNAVTRMADHMGNEGSSSEISASLVHKTKAIQMVEEEEEGLEDSTAVIVAELFME
jgi:hypothetical protein